MAKDNVKIANNNKDILNINKFAKLITTVQNSSNFKNHKTLFWHSFYFFI